jgi:hypothetical protein
VMMRGGSVCITLTPPLTPRRYSHTVFTLLLHFCHTTATIVTPTPPLTGGGHRQRQPGHGTGLVLLHCCYTVVTLLLHCYESTSVTIL